MNGGHAELQNLMERLEGAQPYAGGHNGAAVLEGFGDADTQTMPARDPDDPSTWGRVGRNEACPCNSGRKYKHCHGALNA